VELAAYCGSEGARLVVSDPFKADCSATRPCWECADANTNGALFYPGLDRWNSPLVLARAALAAGRVALCSAAQNAPTWESDARTAIEAAAAWVACPCEEHREACERLYLADGRVGDPFNATLGIACGLVGDATHTIGLLARLAGEQPVREAIQRDLANWSLA
jgi:hypothetical protein